MNVGSVQPQALPLPALSPEEMMTIVASRPALRQQQSVALAGLHAGPSDTSAVDQDGHIDLYA